MQLFGYEINKKVSSQHKAAEEKIISPIPKINDDGGATVTVGGGYYGQYVDLEGTNTVSDHELIIEKHHYSLSAMPRFQILLMVQLLQEMFRHRLN